jgi:hypothetical protein
MGSGLLLLVLLAGLLQHGAGTAAQQAAKLKLEAIKVGAVACAFRLAWPEHELSHGRMAASGHAPSAPPGAHTHAHARVPHCIGRGPHCGSAPPPSTHQAPHSVSRPPHPAVRGAHLGGAPCNTPSLVWPSTVMP